MQFSICLLLLAARALAVDRGVMWSGYWEGWANEDEDVSWWDDNIPGNCAPGCVVQKGFFGKGQSYNSLTYSFITLLKQPTPDQNGCEKTPCPVWDGRAIYNEKDTAITASSTIEKPSPSVVALGDFCRYARTFPGGPKRCILGFGGWSDWARISTTANAEKIGELIAKLVLFTFADGVDLDFEHLSEYTKKYGEGEIPAYIAMVKAIRNGFNIITEDAWKANVNKRIATVTAGEACTWRTQMLKYLPEVASNGKPYLEIMYTTRFNAFLNPDDPWDYLDPNSTHPASYITDNEGQKVWPGIGSSTDTLNIMSYDMDPGMKLNFGKILYNYHTFGKVPKMKLNIGFEPGEQASGETWEGEERDIKAVDYINSNGYGGAMIWGVNPDKKDDPHSYKITPGFVKNVSAQLKYPAWPWGTAPKYTPISN